MILMPLLCHLRISHFFCLHDHHDKEQLSLCLMACLFHRLPFTLLYGHFSFVRSNLFSVSFVLLYIYLSLLWPVLAYFFPLILCRKGRITYLFSDFAAFHLSLSTHLSLVPTSFDVSFFAIFWLSSFRERLSDIDYCITM